MIKEEPTCQVTVYIAGDIAVAKQALRQECMRKGLCVTITPNVFVYTGGAEDGMAIGFVNYPRFPKTVEEISERAVEVAKMLMHSLCQTSALIVGPVTTTWISERQEDN